MSRPGRTALWQNLLRDNQKPASALDAVISVILPNGTNGTHLSATHPSRSSRCPELASSYYLCHYRPTSACFCHRLYTSARRSSRSSRSACSACSAAPASQPARRLLCLLCLLCRSAALPAPVRLPAKKARLSKVSLFYYPVWAFVSPPPRLSARQSRKPSRTSCSRILAQSATGCFSPSTNRSGQPRLQSSM